MPWRERALCAPGRRWSFAAAAAIALLCSGGAPSAAQTTEETAIRDVVRQYAEARNRQDAKALEALFVSDADQLVSSGEWRRGRDAVVKGSLTSSQARAGQRAFTVDTVRVVSPGVALVDSRYEIGASEGTVARRMWATWLLVKTPEGWRIAAIRNMLPAPPAPAR
jgi:uncharacterized protein (TIGR02246 family)